MASITLMCSVHSSLPAEQHRVDYVDELDTYCIEFGRAKKKRADYGGITNVSTDEYGMTVDYFCYNHLTPREAERLANCVVEFVQEHKIPAKHQVHLIKEVTDKSGSSLFRRRLFPTRKTIWKKAAPTSRQKTEVATLPKRIQYLAKPAAKYFLADGGDDPAPCIGWDDEERDEYLAALAKEEQGFLAGLFKQIVSRKDHEWIIDWYGDYEEGEGPELTDQEEMAISQAIFLIQFLHRLKQGGLLTQYKGKWKDVSIFPNLDEWYSDCF